MGSAVGDLGPSIEALLHLATFSFAMTLAYIGLDKVGEDSRSTLEAEIAKRAAEVRKVLRRDDVLVDEEQVGRLKNFIAQRRDKKAVCMLARLAGHTVERQLYGPLWRHIRIMVHSFELLLCYKWFLNHLDRIFVGFMCVATGVVFFALTYAAVFHLTVNQVQMACIFWFEVFSILTVAASVWGFATSSRRLQRRYTRWRRYYDAWVAEFKSVRVETAKQLTSGPVLDSNT